MRGSYRGYDVLSMPLSSSGGVVLLEILNILEGYPDLADPNLAADPVRRMRVEEGDVVVWGGPARFVYHGVAPVKEGIRLNLTFRKVF